MSTSVFTESFLEQVKDVLENKCQDGAAITRNKLCQELGLEPAFEGAVGTVVTMGLIPGYDMRKGRGIGLKGAKSNKRVAEPELTEEFLGLLKATLEDTCPEDGKCVPRKSIADAMGETGLKVENMISAALKRDDFSDFEARPGRFGGVRRVSVAEEETDNDDTVVVSDPSTDTMDTSVEEQLSQQSDIPTYRNPDSPIARHHAELRSQDLND